MDVNERPDPQEIRDEIERTHLAREAQREDDDFDRENDCQ